MKGEVQKHPQRPTLHNPQAIDKKDWKIEKAVPASYPLGKPEAIATLNSPQHFVTYFVQKMGGDQWTPYWCFISYVSYYRDNSNPT